MGKEFHVMVLNADDGKEYHHSTWKHIDTAKKAMRQLNAYVGYTARIEEKGVE